MKKNKYLCYVANDNSNGQVVVSGLMSSIEKFEVELINKKLNM